MRTLRALRGPALFTLTASVWLLSAGSASAAIGVVNPEATPATTQAGAQTALELGFDVSGGEDQLRDVTIELPPGLVGNPQAVAKCPIATFNAGSCTSASAVGTTTVTTAILLPPPFGGATPISGTVYNLVPNSGEPARLGLELASIIPGVIPEIRTQVAVVLRPDFGLSTVITDLPNQVVGIPIFPTSISLSLSQAFISNPSSCDPALTRFKIRSYAMGPSTPPATGLTSFTPTGCDTQPYDPKVSITIGDGGTLSSSVPPAVSTSITQAPGQANTRRLELTLPAGLGANSDLILAGDFCPVPSFEAGTCSASQQVGDALAESPLLPAPLSGAVYLVSSGGLLPRIGLDLRGALNLKLFGDSTVVGGTRLATTFDGLPDLPLPRFDLTFDGGPGGLFSVGDDLCKGTPAFQASFISQGDRALTTSGTASIRNCPPVVQEQTAKKKKCKANAKRGTKAKGAKKAKRCKKKKPKKK